MDYIDERRRMPITETSSSGSPGMTNGGTDLAAYLSKGRSWDDAVDIQRNQLARLAPGWNRWDVAGVLIYSQSALCPELLPQP